MTTAHRPTYSSSIGRTNIYSNQSTQFSSKDLPGNLEIKKRTDINKNLNRFEQKMLLRKREKESNCLDEDNNLEIKKRKIEEKNIKNEKTNVIFEQDKDYEYSSDENLSEELNNEEEIEDSDSDNTEMELLAELQKIQNYQEKEKINKEIEKNIMMEKEIFNSNPLFKEDQEFSLNKKWYEDTIFKNQNKLEKKQIKRFINDTVRSDFHRKFLSKTIQ